MILYSIRYLTSLICGMLLTFELAGVERSRRSMRIFIIATIVFSTLQVVITETGGLGLTVMTYPLHTHLLLFLLLIFVFKRKPVHALNSVLIAYMCCQLPSYISKIAIYFGGHIHTEVLLYCVAFSIWTAVLFRFATKTICRFIESSDLTAYILLVIPLGYYVFDYTATVWTSFLYSGNYHITQFMPTLIGVSYILFAVIFIREYEKKKGISEEKELIDIQLNYSRIQLEKLNRINELSRIYRHDMRHHFQYLLTAIRQEQYEEIEKYIAGNIAALDRVAPKNYCQNDSLNMILSQAAAKCEDNGIRYSIQVEVGERLPLETTELVAIISNATENAVNALRDCSDSEKYFDVKIKENQRKLVISLENTCKDVVEMENGLPVTSSPEHGIGTRSILTIAKAHEGTAHFYIENRVFHVLVIIPVN